MTGLLVGLLGPVVAGFLCARLLCRGSGQGAAWLLGQLALGTGLGLGLSSCAYFLWLVTAGSTSADFVLVELPLLAVLSVAALVLARLRRPGTSPAPPAERPRPHWLTWGPPVACAAASLIAGARFAWLALRSPHGDWDAWSIWNLHGRFLFRGGADWRALFTNRIAWSHPDYPLLVPAAVARCWQYAGGETPLAPLLVAGLFTFAAAGLLGATVTRLRGRSAGCLAVTVLLATPFYIDLGSAQYADVPLGFYVLASLALLALADREDGPLRLLPLLAGIMAGFAVWTKNEGLLFLVLLAAVRTWSTLKAGGWRAAGRGLVPPAAGALPAVALLLWFKFHLAPPNDLVAGQDWRATTARLTDWVRYPRIALELARATVPLLPGVAGLVAYWLLAGRAAVRPGWRAAGAAPWVLGLMLLAYYGVYLISPWERPESHAYYSFDRLVMQLWPAALLAFFLAAATPEEALARTGPLSPQPAPVGAPRSTMPGSGAACNRD